MSKDNNFLSHKRKHESCNDNPSQETIMILNAKIEHIKELPEEENDSTMIHVQPVKQQQESRQPAKHEPSQLIKQNSFIRKNDSFKRNNTILPIDSYRDLILSTIYQNQVTIIAGETGCGKTTKVPQFLYENCLSKNIKPNIIITQPRRIAATSIANRLTKEFNLNPHDKLIGYHVGMEPNFNSSTQILIVTTGIFLQRLVNERTINDYTHIIIDEVHERDVDIDFVLIILKHYLKGTNVKLILMSATISTVLFSNYFSKAEIENIDQSFYYKSELYQKVKLQQDDLYDDQGWYKESKVSANVKIDANVSNEKSLTDAAPIITITERLFKSEVYYFEKILPYLDRDLKTDKFKRMKIPFMKTSPSIDKDVYKIASSIIKLILNGSITNENGGCYSVLVFLPGVPEIYQMGDMLDEELNKEEKQSIVVLPLHSNITDDQQKEIFQKFDNKRKVILSTNIAESSITIPDVVYVIDFCFVKEIRCSYKNLSMNQNLHLSWASKASCDQRKGRAGRVRDGFVFRLLASASYYQLNSFSSPELTRCPLEKVILRTKVWNHGEPSLILGRAIDPPLKDNIDSAINNLFNNGALTWSDDKTTGSLTALGIVFAELPLEIKYSRLIMLSFAFDLIEPGIILSSILSQEKKIIKHSSNKLLNRNFIEAIDLGCKSDLLLTYNLYKLWERKFHAPNLIDNEDNYRYKFKSSTDVEAQWCESHYTKRYILNETYRVALDLKKRLNKMNLYNSKEVRKVPVFSYYAEEPAILDVIIDNNNDSDRRIIKEMLDIDVNTVTIKEIIQETSFNKKISLSSNISLMSKQESAFVQPRSKYINKSVLSENSNKDDLLLMKIILAGAFHDKLINCIYSNISNVRKNKNIDIKYALKIKNLPQGYSVGGAEKIKSFFKHYFNITIKSVDIYSEDAHITLDPISYNNTKNDMYFQSENSIIDPYDRILSKDNENDLENNLVSKIINVINNSNIINDFVNKIPNSNSAYESSRSSFNTFNQLNNGIRLENQPKAEYLYTLNFREQFTSAEIIINSNSINADIVNDSEELVSKIFLICENIQNRLNKSSIAKNTTLMPKSDMGLLLLLIIFSPKVVFYSNETKDRYEAFEITGSRIKFQFNYLFSTVDIEQINKIRECLSKIVINETDKSTLISYKEALRDKLKEVWNKKRIKIISKPDWWRLYFHFYPNENNQQIYLKKYSGNTEFSSISDTSFKKPNLKESNDFLPMLKPIDIEEDYRLWTTDGIKLLSLERLKFEAMKEKLENSLISKKKLCTKTRSEVICSICKGLLTELDCLKESENKIVIEIRGYLSGFINTFNPNDEKIANSSYLQSYNKNFSLSPDYFFSCKSDHVLGFSVKGHHYITKESEILINHPTEVHEPFNFILDLHRNRENALLTKRKELTKKITCELCNLDYSSAEKFLEHLKKNEHVMLLSEFMNECYIQEDKSRVDS